MAEVALNKDGKPRKKGSGKTRGAGCYAKIPWSDLKKFIGAEVYPGQQSVAAKPECRYGQVR